MSVFDLPRPVAFVLSGGGAYGAGQLGQLRALAEAGIEPDLVVGTSVGALHGAVVARHGPDALDRLEMIWADLDRADVFGPLRAVAANLVRTRRPATAERLRRLVFDTLGPGDVADLPLPFAAVATDSAEGRPIVLDHGPLATVLAASAAIPGVFPPMPFEGRSLIDGGVSANLPVRQAADLGAASIVALDVTPVETTTPSGPGLLAGLVQAGAIMLRNQASWVVDDRPVLHLPAPVSADAGLFAFRRWEAFRDEGYRVAVASLEAADR